MTKWQNPGFSILFTSFLRVISNDCVPSMSHLIRLPSVANWAISLLFKRRQWLSKAVTLATDNPSKQVNKRRRKENKRKEVLFPHCSHQWPQDKRHKSQDVVWVPSEGKRSDDLNVKGPNPGICICIIHTCDFYFVLCCTYLASNLSKHTSTNLFIVLPNPRTYFLFYFLFWGRCEGVKPR